MAKRSNPMMKIIGLVLMTVGVGLLVWGYQISGGVSSQVSQALTGSASEGVVVRYIAGAASFVAGIFVFIKK